MKVLRASIVVAASTLVMAIISGSAYAQESSKPTAAADKPSPTKPAPKAAPAPAHHAHGGGKKPAAKPAKPVTAPVPSAPIAVPEGALPEAVKAETKEARDSSAKPSRTSPRTTANPTTTDNTKQRPAERESRIEFDERTVSGQAASGAIYLFQRAPSELKSIIDVPDSFRARTVQLLRPQGGSP